MLQSHQVKKFNKTFLGHHQVIITWVSILVAAITPRRATAVVLLLFASLIPVHKTASAKLARWLREEKEDGDIHQH
jgi:hypothetical protein